MVKRIWMTLFVLLVFLTGCQGASSDSSGAATDQAATTEVVTEAGTEEATEPRWTKFVEFKIDEYLHSLPEGAYVVTPDMLLEEMDKGSKMTLLDLRTSEAYEAGHLEGSVNAPFGSDFYSELANIKMDQPVYVYCDYGQLSGQAHVMLRLLGFESYAVTLGWDYGIAQFGDKSQRITTDQSLLEKGQNQLDEDVLEEVKAYLDSLGGTEDKGYENHMLSPAVLNDWLVAGKEMTLISVQSEDAYEKGRIKGAINLAYDGHFAHDLLETDLKPLVVVYDDEGQISGQAVVTLRLLGYEAYALEGGLGTPQNAPLGWINGGFGIER